jgi:hypothetical protein
MGNLFKYIGALLAFAGVVIVIFDRASGAEIPLLVGLFLLFVSKGKMEDERMTILKSSSAFLALVVGYACKLLTTNLY